MVGWLPCDIYGNYGPFHFLKNCWKHTKRNTWYIHLMILSCGSVHHERSWIFSLSSKNGEGLQEDVGTLACSNKPGVFSFESNGANFSSLLVRKGIEISGMERRRTMSRKFLCINGLREPQHTPGAYPMNPQTPKWKESLHKLLVGGLGYVPGVCWIILRNGVIYVYLSSDMYHS